MSLGRTETVCFGCSSQFGWRNMTWICCTFLHHSGIPNGHPLGYRYFEALVEFCCETHRISMDFWHSTDRWFQNFSGSFFCATTWSEFPGYLPFRMFKNSNTFRAASRRLIPSWMVNRLTVPSSEEGDLWVCYPLWQDVDHEVFSCRNMYQWIPNQNIPKSQGGRMNLPLETPIWVPVCCFFLWSKLTRIWGLVLVHDPRKIVR